jgi:glucokinase
MGAEGGCPTFSVKLDQYHGLQGGCPPFAAMPNPGHHPNMTHDPDCVILGVDIGGTKVGVCVGDLSGRVIAADRLATGPAAAPETTLDWAFRRLDALRAQHCPRSSVAALGAACPGPLSYAEGRFLSPPNMPRWHDFPIRESLSQRAGCAVAVMNDANATALAEWLWGAARGTDTAIFLTMSTGMGAGLILGGRLFEGPLGLAGEIGHIRLRDDGPVGFAKRGSVEGYLSGPGMVQVARSELLVCEQAGESTVLADLAARPAGLTAETLCAAARQGDAAALRVLERCATELGRLLALLTDILNPDVFVLGTIGSEHFELFAPRARAVLNAEAISFSARHVRIERSGLPDRGNQSALAAACHVHSESCANGGSH